MEARPQAVEWSFHVAAGYFYASADNLSGDETNQAPFEEAVVQAAQAYRRRGWPPRHNAGSRLAERYGGQQRLQDMEYERAAIGRW